MSAAMASAMDRLYAKYPDATDKPRVRVWYPSSIPVLLDEVERLRTALGVRYADA